MSECYVGEVRMFSGNYAPENWVMCNGQLLSVSQYQVLFSLLGTVYGGDGVTTFGVPDLRGRVPIHKSADYPLGAKSGTETVSLLESQLPPHTHLAAAQSTVGSADTPANAYWAASSAGKNIYTTDVTTTALSGMAPGAILPAGGSLPHENMMPFFPLTFIMSTLGIYPQRQ